MSGHWQSSNRRSRLPPDWDKRRLRVLHRDGHRCTWLEDGARCAERATDVDHVINNDDHDEKNLRSLCDPHHKRKTQAEAAAARARNPRKRPSPKHPGLVEGGG